jgi:hypothetical protein
MKKTAHHILTALSAIALAAVAVLLPVDSGYSQQSRFEGKK